MAEKTFHQKVVQIQTSLVAPKGQENSFGHYKYRSCEDILEAVKPLLKEAGLTLTLNDEIIQIGERYYIQAIATLSEGTLTEKGAHNLIQVSGLAREPLNRKGMDEAQVTGATSSYARKYALNGLFCIDDSKDADVEPEKKKKIVVEPLKVDTNEPQKPIEDEEKENKPLSTNQRFLATRKTLGDKDYYFILSKFGVKSATDFKEEKDALEALKALENNVELKEFTGSDDQV